MPSSGGPSGGIPATTVVGPDAFGSVAAVGASSSYARGDHDHGLPAAPVATISYASLFISADIPLPALTATTVQSLSLAAGTWLVIGQLTIVSGASLGDISIFLWDTVTYYGTTSLVAATTGDYYGLVCHGVIVLTGTVTITLAARPVVAMTAKATGQFAAAGNHASGITALKMA